MKEKSKQTHKKLPKSKTSLGSTLTTARLPKASKNSTGQVKKLDSCSAGKVKHYWSKFRIPLSSIDLNSFYEYLRLVTVSNPTNSGH